jgi:chromosome segregation ATPase
LPSEQRFTREGAKSTLAELPIPEDREAFADASDLLSRLERQAAESGRLEGQVESLEQALESERDARRRLAATLKRERKAAAALHARAEEAEATAATQAEELDRLRQAVSVAEQHAQVIWMQLADAERQLAARPQPSRLDRLLRREPSA